MGAFDLSRYLWPDAAEGRQPQGGAYLSEEINPANSCIYLPSAGAVDLATGKSLSVTGTPQIVANKRGLAVYSTPSTGAYFRTLVAGDGIRGQGQYILFGVYELGPYDGGYDAIAVQMSGGYGTRVDLGSHGNYQTSTAVGCYVRPNNDYQTLDSTHFAANNKMTVAATLMVKTGQKPILIAQHEDGFYEELTLSATVSNAADAFGMISFASSGYMLSVPTPGARRLMLGGVLAQPNLSIDLARRLAKDPFGTLFAGAVGRLSFPVSANSAALEATADGTAQTSGSAGLTAQVTLAGIGVSLAAGSGALSVDVPLSAAGIALAVGTANSTATVSLTASALAQAAGSAGLSAGIFLSAASAALAAGNADLAIQLTAQATGAAQATGSAVPAAQANPSAAGLAETSGLSILNIVISLQAGGGSQSNGTATPTTSASGSLNAQGAVNTDGSAHPAVSAEITASGSAATSGSAHPSSNAGTNLTGLGYAESAGTGHLLASASLSAAGFIHAMGSGALIINIPLQAIGHAQSAGSANLTPVPDYLPLAPLQLIAQVAHNTRLHPRASRQITLRHEVSRVLH